jgi:hypothetical protein
VAVTALVRIDNYSSDDVSLVNTKNHNDNSTIALRSYADASVWIPWATSPKHVFDFTTYCYHTGLSWARMTQNSCLLLLFGKRTSVVRTWCGIPIPTASRTAGLGFVIPANQSPATPELVETDGYVSTRVTVSQCIRTFLIRSCLLSLPRVTSGVVLRSDVMRCSQRRRFCRACDSDVLLCSPDAKSSSERGARALRDRRCSRTSCSTTSIGSGRSAGIGSCATPTTDVSTSQASARDGASWRASRGTSSGALKLRFKRQKGRSGPFGGEVHRGGSIVMPVQQR